MTILKAGLKPAATSSTGYPPLQFHKEKPTSRQRAVQVRSAQPATGASRGLDSGRLKVVPSPGPHPALHKPEPALPAPPPGYVDPIIDRPLPRMMSAMPAHIAEDEPPPPPPHGAASEFVAVVRGLDRPLPGEAVRDLKIAANRHAARIEKAGAAFVNVAVKLHDHPAFDPDTQGLTNSRLFADRIIKAARHLDTYEKLQQSSELPKGVAKAMRDIPKLPITGVVQGTRAAIASALENLLTSDEFAMGELDLDQLNGLAAALKTLGVPTDRLDDRISAATRALAGTRPRFFGTDELSNFASPARPVPIRKQFIQDVRAPQRNITFLGFTIRRRDTAYKELLASLDAYHAVANGKPASLAEAQAVRAAFERAKYSVEGYVANLRNTQSDRDAVHAQVLPLQRELAVLDRAIRRIKSSPEGLPADLQPVCSEERTAAAEIFSMVRGPGSAFTELNAQGAVRHGLMRELARICATRSPEREAGMKPLGKGAINTVYLAKVGLPDNQRGFSGVYKRNSESVDESSLAAGISQDRPTSALRNLATWRIAQRLQLDVIPETYLVLNGAELGCILERARGVSPLHTGSREVPVSPEVALRLRDDPDLLKSFARQKGYLEAAIEGTTVKLTMERTTKAPDGSVLHEEFDSLNPVDFSSSALRRELTRLQWLDALTGQCDRHAHNYFVERDAEGGVRVRGIDNDMAFGAGVNNPDKLPGGHSPRLPKVIDSATAKLLRGLKPEELEKLCVGLGPEEIDSAKQRLKFIKDRIVSYEQADISDPDAGRIIDADADWSASEISKLLGVHSFDHIGSRTEGGDHRAMNKGVGAAFKASYVARDHTTQVAGRKGFSPMPLFDAAELQKGLEKLGTQTTRAIA